MVTNWTKMVDPTKVPLSEFILIDGTKNNLGSHRMPNPWRKNKQEESNILIGRAPRIIHVAYCDFYNPVGITGPKYALLSGANAWQTSIDFGRDPRDDNFEVWIAPEDKTNPIDLAVIRIKLNRAQSAASPLDVIGDYAKIDPEYLRMLTLVQRYSHVSPTDVAICLNPNGGLTAKLQGIENRTFVATDPIRGAEAVEMLDYIRAELERQNRVDFTRKNAMFVQELALRFISGTFMIDYSGYPGVNPAQQAGMLYLGDPKGHHPTLTTKNTISFKKIQCDVLTHDKNFPLKPFTGRHSVKKAWIDSVLDSMAIPAHP